MVSADLAVDDALKKVQELMRASDATPSRVSYHEVLVDRRGDLLLDPFKGQVEGAKVSLLVSDHGQAAAHSFSVLLRQ